MRKSCFAFCVLMLAATPASANPSPVGNQVVSNDAGSLAPVAGGRAPTVSEKKVCKRLPSSSSRMTKRVCLTADEWRQVEEEIR